MIGGIEFGGTKCVLAVANNPLDIIEKKIIPTRDPKRTFSDIFLFFNEFKVDSLGIGIFGPIILNKESLDYGLLVSESKKGWKGINVFSEISNNITADIKIDTDVNVAASAEHTYGSGRNCRILVYVTVGTGIGAGVLFDGKPHIGNFHLEMGHIRVPNQDNFRGVCDIHGDCWEGLASGPSIEARWGIPAVELPNSHEAWKKEAELLANGLISIIATHSPDRIILGGGVMKQTQLFPMIRKRLGALWKDYTPLGPLSKFLVKPGLGSDSGIIGSLIMAELIRDGKI